MSHDAPVLTQNEERAEAQLVRAIGIPALTANIVNSTIGAGIFVLPALVAKGLGPAAPLAFLACAIATPEAFTRMSKSRSAATSDFSPACFTVSRPSLPLPAS